MKLAAALALALVLPIAPTRAAAKPLPKDCSRAFARAWENRGAAGNLPKPKDPCVLRGETGIYVCTANGCARP